VSFPGLIDSWTNYKRPQDYLGQNAWFPCRDMWIEIHFPLEADRCRKTFGSANPKLAPSSNFFRPTSPRYRMADDMADECLQAPVPSREANLLKVPPLKGSSPAPSVASTHYHHHEDLFSANAMSNLDSRSYGTTVSTLPGRSPSPAPAGDSACARAETCNSDWRLLDGVGSSFDAALPIRSRQPEAVGPSTVQGELFHSTSESEQLDDRKS